MSTSKEPCSVCHDDVEIYAIGQCDHPICFKCSSRMRVLCDQMYCAICRTDLPKILYMQDISKCADVDTTPLQLLKKYNIYFENEDIQNQFYELISHKCKFCPGMKPFKTFSDLERHTRRDHRLHFCDICVIHLKVFSWERKCYDREYLARHKRVGDDDDTSLKGHPLCELCDVRFLDRDELARHCRKEHFRCHFCENDGISLEFFATYDVLREHFRDYHYLCEEGECYEVQFTNAFRSEIDMKAHRATSHRRTMKKAEARQARTIEVDIQLPPRPTRGRGRGRGGRNNTDREGFDGDSRKYARQQRDEIETAVAASLSMIQKESGSIAVVDPVFLNPMHQQRDEDIAKYKEQTGDFPTLNGKTQQLPAPDSDEDASSKQKELSANSRDSLARKVARSSNFSIREDEMADGDFPTLSGRGRASQKVSQSQSGAWQLSRGTEASDFPSLASQKPSTTSASRNRYPGASQKYAPAQAWTEDSTKVKQLQEKPKKPVSSFKHTDEVSGVYSRMSDYPSLSSIGSSLMSVAAPPSPKLSVIRSSAVQPTAEPGRQFQRPPNFSTDDFPSMGGKKEVSVPTRKWGSQKEPSQSSKPAEPQHPKHQELPKKEVKLTKGMKPYQDEKQPQQKQQHAQNQGMKPKQEEKQQPQKQQPQQKQQHAQNQGMKPKHDEKQPQPKLPHAQTQEDWQSVKSSKSSKNVSAKPATETKQTKEMENLVAQQTKSKKKKKGSKGQTSPRDGDSRSGDTSDRDSEREDKKHEPSAKQKQPHKNSEKVSDNVNPKLPLCGGSSGRSSPVVNGVKNPQSSVNASEITALKPKVNNVPEISAGPDMVHVGRNIIQKIGLTTEDFPVLGSTGGAAAPPPPGFTQTGPSRPPPGFGTTAATLPAKPPPGFKCQAENIENVAPALIEPIFQYIQPGKFKERNQQLIKDIQDMLSDDRFQKFKMWSGKFRQAEITASEYYSQCCNIIGASEFQQIYPELLALLPDIKKQQELLTAHNNAPSQASIKITKRQWNTSQFKVCPTCSQVVIGSDFSTHVTGHEIDTDFPSLGMSLGTPGATLGTWGKK